MASEDNKHAEIKPELVKKRDDHGNVITFVRYHGHIFFENFPTDVEYRLRILPSFQSRADDIIFCSYPKSGLHWVSNIVGMLTSRNSSYKGTLMFPEHHAIADFATMPSPRTYAFHCLYDLLPTSIKSGVGRIIYISRNPKDLVVSYYHFLTGLPFDFYHGDFSGFLNFFLSDEFYFDTWFSFVKSWEKGLRNRDDVLQIQYEDLHMDIKGSIKRLCKYLEIDCSDEFVQEVVSKSSIGVFKTEQRKREDDGTDQNPFMRIMYRKGLVGDWKNYFTVAQSDWFDRVYEKKMTDSKLRYVYNVQHPIK